MQKSIDLTEDMSMRSELFLIRRPEISKSGKSVKYEYRETSDRDSVICHENPVVTNIITEDEYLLFIKIHFDYSDVTG